MKKILTILLITVASIGFSQNKLHLGLQINGNFTTGISSTSNWPSEYYKGIETFSFCYSAGGIIEYELTNKSSVQSGLLYRKSGDKSEIFPTEPFRPFPLGYSFKKYGIEVPLNLKFKLVGKLKFIIGTSIAYNLFSSSFYHESNSTFKTIYSENEINPLDIYGNAGVEYNFTNKFLISIYSQFDILKTEYNTWTLPNPARNYLSFGLNIGYNFN